MLGLNAPSYAIHRLFRQSGDVIHRNAFAILRTGRNKSQRLVSLENCTPLAGFWNNHSLGFIIYAETALPNLASISTIDALNSGIKGTLFFPLTSCHLQAVSSVQVYRNHLIIL